MSFGGFLRMTLIDGRALLVLLTLPPRKGPQVLLTQLYPLFWFLLLSGMTIPPLPSASLPGLFLQALTQCSYGLCPTPNPQGQSGLGWKELQGLVLRDG